MSKINWNKTITEINKKRFSIPAGWETKEEVAASLQCDPDRVTDILKPGIASGDIERQEFPVWDDKRRLTVRVPCYRLAGDKVAPVVAKAPEAKSSGKRGPKTAPRDERIRAAIKRFPEKTDAGVAKALFGVKGYEVAAIRARM